MARTLAGTALLFAAVACGQSAVVPKAEQGVIDLRTWQFTRDGSLRLEGEWRFFWNNLIPASATGPASDAQAGTAVQVPAIWNQTTGGERTGHATYRLRLLLPEKQPPLALRIEPQQSAYVAYWNGVPVARDGVVAEKASEYRPWYSLQIVDLPEAHTATLLVHAANHAHRFGGLSGRISIGPREELVAAHRINLATSAMLAGILLSMGLYHLGLYAVRRQERGALWFGLLTLTVSVRVLSTGPRILTEVFPELSWTTALRLEYLGFYAAVPFSVLFLGALFPDQFPRWWLRTVAFASGIACAVVAAFPADIFSHSLDPFTLVAAAAGFHAIAATAIAVYRRAEGARMVFVGTTVFAGATMADMVVYQLSANNDYSLLTPVGLLALTIFHATVLLRRVGSAYRTSERLSQNLEKIVGDRTIDLMSEKQAAAAEREQANRLRDEAVRLGQLVKSINEQRNLRDMLGDIFAYLSERFRVDGIILMTLDERRSELVPIDVRSGKPALASEEWIREHLRIPTSEAGGLLARVFRRRRPFFLPDARARDIFRKEYPGADLDRAIVERLDLNSFFLLPLVVQNSPIGMLLFTSYGPPLRLKPTDISTLQRFGDQIAGAVQTTLLLEEVRDAKQRTALARAAIELVNQDLTRLNDFAKLLNSLHETQAVVDAIYDYVHAAFQVSKGWLVRVEERDGLFRYEAPGSPDAAKAWLSALEGFAEQPIHPVSGMLYEVYVRRRIVHLPKISRVRDIMSDIDRALADAAQVSDVLYVPLVLEDKVVGMLGMGGIRRGTFRGTGRIHLQAFAEQAASAMQRVLLAQRTRADSQRMAAIGQMAAGIIHDLKNPMTTIKAYAEMSDSDVGREKRKRYLETISEEADRLSGMLFEILEFARGKQDLRRRDADLCALLRDLLRLKEPESDALGVRVTQSLQLAEPVSMDPDRMRRALLNIVGNALEALELVAPERRNLFVGVARHGSKVEIRIRDTGPGIPEEIRGHLFESFATANKARGTGLGLSIARAVVDEHGGSIDVESSEQGTEFLIRVPAGTPAEPDEVERRSAADRRRGEDRRRRQAEAAALSESSPGRKGDS